MRSFFTVFIVFERNKDKHNSFYIVGVNTSFKHKRRSQKKYHTLFWSNIPFYRAVVLRVAFK